MEKIKLSQKMDQCQLYHLMNKYFHMILSTIQVPRNPEISLHINNKWLKKHGII